MSYYNNQQPHTNPLTFPSYNNNQALNHRSNLLSLAGGSLNEKNPLNNLKHRLPHPQESQHHQHISGSGSVNTHLSTNVNHGIPQQMSGSSPTSSKSDTSALPKIKKERKNRPGQKFGAKKKSWVWSWFVQDNLDPNVAACDVCGKIITRLPSDKGSPKKLSEHLKTHKLDKDSINESRPIPIDGNGVTYNPNGVQLSFLQQQAQQAQQTQQLQAQQIQHQQISQNIPNTHSSSSSHNGSQVDSASNLSVNDVYKQRALSSILSNADASQMGFSLNQNNRKFLSKEFDNSPYSSTKFHKHLLKFLMENKLSMNVIKSHSFQQIIYDLRNDSVTELNDLTNLYGTLLEVSRFDSGNSAMASVDEVNVVNSMAQAVEQKSARNQ